MDLFGSGTYSSTGGAVVDVAVVSTNGAVLEGTAGVDALVVGIALSQDIVTSEGSIADGKVHGLGSSRSEGGHADGDGQDGLDGELHLDL